jgi:hypothetical protein
LTLILVGGKIKSIEAFFTYIWLISAKLYEKGQNHGGFGNEMKRILDTEKRPWRKLKAWLDGLDRRNAQRLESLRQKLKRFDQWSSNLWQQDRQGARHLKAVVWNGASKGFVKKRTGRVWLDKLSAIWYGIWQKLDKLDTKFAFPGRQIQAKACRVRSKAEKTVANWLTDNGVKFKYEKPLVLGVKNPVSRFGLELIAPISNQWLLKHLVKQCGGVLLHPDFYLSSFGVYVEYWGLADSDADYDRNHRDKLALYGRHKIRVISLYPRHLRAGMDNVFADLFQKTTGRVLPRKERR